MPCDVDVRQCLAWHIKDKLTKAKLIKKGEAIRAQCPVCGARDGLEIGRGDWHRITWWCYAGCGRADIRRALTARKVPAGCLPPVTKDEKDIGEMLEATRQSARYPKQAMLRSYLIGLGYQYWPSGSLLTQLASEISVSRRCAYDAKEAGPLRPDLREPGPADPCSVRIPAEQHLSSPARQGDRLGPNKCSPPHSVRPTALTQVQPTALYAGNATNGEAP